MVTITPWPIVSYVTRKKPSEGDPRGNGAPGNTNDPAQYFDVPAAIIEIVQAANPTRMRLAVLSYVPFTVVADEFDPLAPIYRTFKLRGPTLLSETFPIDPPNIAAGAHLVTGTLAVPGAQFGDVVVASWDADLQGMQLTAYVSAAGFCQAVVRNGTAGAINLAPGTIRINVWRQ